MGIGAGEGIVLPPSQIPRVGPAAAKGDQEGSSPSMSNVEGSTFVGAAILSQTNEPKKGKKFKIAALKVANITLVIKETTEFALGMTSLMIEQARAIHEISKAFFEPLQVLDKIFLPLRFVGWAHAPFVVFNLGSDIVDFFATPSWRKILPAIKTVVDIAVIAEMAANAALLLQRIGVVAAQNVHIWAFPMGVGALGIQSLGLVVNSWGFVEVTRSLKKFNKEFKEGMPQQNYKEAVTFLTKQPETRAEKFRKKFFKVISSKQQGKLQSIYEKSKLGELDKPAVEKALRAIKHHFHLKQFTYALSITAAITGMIGVVILLTVPAPIAPVGWFFIAMSAAMSITLVGVSIYASKRLDKELSAIDPEPRLQQPFYQRAYRRIRRKFRRTSDGSFDPIIVN
ncbi:MAG: hypothetical protein ACSNEK_06000 [Parachlamydiaceae bacterium]